MTQGHTETRRKEVAEYVGTVQYVVVIDGGGALQNTRNSQGKSMRHEVCIVKNMSSHGLILILRKSVRQT